MLYTRASSWRILVLLQLLALVVATVGAADPTSYLVAYPPRSVNRCGGSPYNITMQAWQTGECTYVIKYSIYGTPGISDWGFPLGGNGRTIGVSGCSANAYQTSGGGGNECNQAGGPYVGWESAGTLIKIETEGCDTIADFWISASLTRLVTDGTGSVGLKGGSNCWTCNAMPYSFAAVASCASASPSPSSPAQSASASPSPSAPSQSASPSPSASASPSPSAPGQSASPSPSAPGQSASPSPSASPSASPSPSAPAESVSPSPSTSASPSSSPAVPPSKSEDSTSGGAIAGAVIGGIAAVGAAGAAVAGAAYLVHRWMNKAAPAPEIASALDTPSSESAGVNALFVDNSAMNPNPLFMDTV